MSTYRTIDAKAELLGGIVDAAAELNDRIIDASGELVTEIRATTYPDYTGEYNVTPTEEAQQLNTAETVLLENVTVDAIPADYVGSGVTRQSELSVSGLTVTAGAGYYEEAVSETVTPNLQSASESYTPTESAQTDTITYDQDHDGLSSVEITVGAIPADYVGSEIPRRDALSVSGATVSGAAGYYDEAVSATVASGSATTPDTSITANPSISVGSDGLISASVSKTQSVTPTVQEGYVTTGTAGNVTVSGSNTSQLPTQAGTTITPSTSVQTAVPAGKFTTGDVKVAAMTNATWKAGSILQPTPSISVDENGLITASVYESTSVQPLSASGYAEKTKWYSVIVNESNTSQLSTQAGTTITPTTSEQTAVAAGKYTTGAVKVAAIQTETASVTPSTTQQSVTPTAGSYLTEVTVDAMPSGSAATPATSITANPSISVSSGGLITATASASESVTPTVTAGYVDTGTAGTVTVSGSNTSQLSTQAGTTITPTTSEQTAVAAGKYTTGAVKVAAMPSGTAGTPTASKGAVSSHSVTVTPSVTNTTGYITGGTKTGTGVSVSASELVSGTKSITANGTGIDVTNYAAVDVSVSGGAPVLETVTKSYTPTESAQSETITPGAGYDGIGEVDVSVGAISSTYVGSGVARRDSTNLSVSGDTVTAQAGYYASSASKSVAAGTAGTPTATKGTVNNHSISVTPSVTNTTGYITGGTKTGTAVTVSASELVSGSETKTANGTYDVTNLAELIVNVAGGGGGLTYETGTYTPSSDIARPTITWANTHTEAPVLVLFSDQTGTAHSTTNSNYNFMYCDFYKLWGHGIPYSSSGFRYAVAYYSYRGNSTSSISSSATVITNNSDSTSSSGTTYPRYWASPTDFHPYSGSTSRYWRSGRTYKWIAVWKPTS